MQRWLQDHVKAASVKSPSSEDKGSDRLVRFVETFRDLRTCLALSPSGSNFGLASLRPSTSDPPTRKYTAFQIGFERYCISLVAHRHGSLEL